MMQATNTAPDLLSVLQAGFVQWQLNGRVQIQDKELPLAVATTATDPVLQFLDFARAYLKLNPVVGAGSSLGAFGVTLADRRHLLFARDTAQEMEGGFSRLVVPYTGLDYPNSRLPPAFDVPITKGG
jgi:hypothetical protein